MEGAVEGEYLGCRRRTAFGGSRQGSSGYIERNRIAVT